MSWLAPLKTAWGGTAATPELQSKGTTQVSGVGRPEQWLVDMFGGGGNNFAGVTVGPDSAMRSTAVLRAVAILSETVAMLPLILFKDEDEAGKTKQKKHPAFSVVFRRPNGWQSAYEFWRMMMMHLLLRGNSFAYIARDSRGRVKQLLPIHPDLVQVYRMDNGMPWYRFRLWFGDAEMMEASQDNILHLRWQSNEGYMGYSPINLCAQSVGINLASEEYQARFFSQGAKLSGIISLPGKLDDNAHDRAVKFWNKFFTGVHNSHRVAVLADGADFKPISIKPQEAQFMELRQFQIEDIARIFGVPPHMLGSTAKNTTWGSGLEQQTLGFLRYTLQPWLSLIQGGCNKDLLLPESEVDLQFEHDLTLLWGGDMAAQAQWASVMYNIGAMNPNEIRRRIGMNPYEGGDQYRVPVNTVPHDSPAASGDPAETAPPAPENPPPQDAPDPQENE